MNPFKRLFMLGVLVLAVGALAIISAPIASLTPVMAQQTTTTNATSPEGGMAAMTEEHEYGSNETSTGGTATVRDSVFALLADQTIPASGFIHLYDTTPYTIKNGHIAAKIPCSDDSAPLLNILIGQAPQFAPAPLELVANLSTPGELCLYHVDLPAPQQAANTTAASTTNATTTTAPVVTDIAIQNPGDEDITLPPTSTVVIGINEIGKGAEHAHEEGEAAQAGTT
ncbi:MAG: hypothetical protein ACJ70Z_06910 [Nitrososphaera sp.]